MLLFSVSLIPSCRTPPGQPPGPQPPTDPPIPPIPEPTDPPIVRPAWRVYHPRKKKKKEQRAPVPPTSAQPPQAGPSHMGPSPMDRHLRQQVASWNTWRRKFFFPHSRKYRYSSFSPFSWSRCCDDTSTCWTHVASKSWIVRGKNTYVVDLWRTWTTTTLIFPSFFIWYNLIIIFWLSWNNDIYL